MDFVDRPLTPPLKTLRLAPRCFLENLALLRLKQAWRAALQLDERRYWLALSNKVQSQWCSTFGTPVIGAYDEISSP